MTTLTSEIKSINERLEAYLNFDSELSADEAMLLSEERERLTNKLEAIKGEQDAMTENEFLLTYAGENVTIKFDTLNEVTTTSMNMDLHKYSGMSVIKPIEGHDNLYGLAMYHSGATPKDRILMARPDDVITHIHSFNCTVHTSLNSDGWSTVVLECWIVDVISEVELESWRCPDCANERCELWNDYIEEVSEDWT